MSPLIRAMAVWALSRLIDDKRLRALAQPRATSEQDEGVRAEWSLVLS
jgi:hypothetical protein